MDTEPNFSQTAPGSFSFEKLLIPGAIIIAGLLIAGGVVLSRGAPVPSAGGDEFANANSAAAENVLPVDLAVDHVRGNPEAPVSIIEWSDYECPFCQQAHPTIARIVDESDGQINWVYRHFPLTQIHSRALRASYASECVAELAGTEAFWDFTDTIFSGASLSDATYIGVAANYGIAETDLLECVDSERHEDKVARDMQNAVQSGGRGTPFMIVVNEAGDPFPFSGALPYEQMKAIVDQALAG